MKGSAASPFGAAGHLHMDVIGSQDGWQGVNQTTGSNLVQTPTNAPRGSQSPVRRVVTAASATAATAAPGGLLTPPAEPGAATVPIGPEAAPGTAVWPQEFILDTKAGTFGYPVSKEVLEGKAQAEKWKGIATQVVDALRKEWPKGADRMQRCAVRVWLREYLLGGRVQKIATWCNVRRVCPACAHARGVKLARAVGARTMEVLRQESELEPWLWTFTVKNGPELEPRLFHVLGSLRKGWERRKNYVKGRRRWSPFCGFEGLVSSVEIKRGRLGDWHPHIHAMVLVPKGMFEWELSKDGPRLCRRQWEQVSAEWHELTGDSLVVNAKPFSSALVGSSVDESELVQDLFEVFKYMTKPGELSPGDVVKAWKASLDHKLVGSYGVMRGVVVPEGLDDPAGDGPYIERYFRWVRDCYRLQGEKFVDEMIGGRDVFVEGVEAGLRSGTASEVDCGGLPF